MTTRNETRVIQLLNEYGFAKFGDEWWPGNADAHLGRTRGQELAELLDATQPPRLTADELHVLLDVIQSWRPSLSTPPWTQYDENPGDPKTSENGWYALLTSAETALTTLLDGAPPARAAAHQGRPGPG